MKKCLFMIMGVACLLCFTGCTKKLECSMEEDNMKYTTIMTFKKDKPEDVTMKIEYKSDDKDELQQYKETFEDQESDMYENLKATIKGNVLTVQMDMNMEEFGLENYENETYDSIKKDAEADGYTCK